MLKIKNLDLLLTLVTMIIVFCVLKFALEIPVSWLDFVGSFFTVVSLLLLKRENYLGLVVGLLGSITLGVYFLIIGLDGQFLSRIFFGAISCISIYFWLKKDKKTGHTKLMPSFSQKWILVIFAVGFWAITIFFGIKSGLIAALDFAIMYLNIGGKFFLVKKKSEGWLMWNIGDVLEIFLFAMSGAYVQLTKTLLILPNNISATVRWFRKSKEN